MLHSSVHGYHLEQAPLCQGKCVCIRRQQLSYGVLLVCNSQKQGWYGVYVGSEKEIAFAGVKLKRVYFCLGDEYANK